MHEAISPDQERAIAIRENIHLLKADTLFDGRMSCPAAAVEITCCAARVRPWSPPYPPTAQRPFSTIDTRADPALQRPKP